MLSFWTWYFIFIFVCIAELIIIIKYLLHEDITRLTAIVGITLALIPIYNIIISIASIVIIIINLDHFDFPESWVNWLNKKVL